MWEGHGASLPRSGTGASAPPCQRAPEPEPRPSWVTHLLRKVGQNLRTNPI